MARQALLAAVPAQIQSRLLPPFLFLLHPLIHSWWRRQRGAPLAAQRRRGSSTHSAVWRRRGSPCAEAGELSQRGMAEAGDLRLRWRRIRSWRGGSGAPLAARRWGAPLATRPRAPRRRGSSARGGGGGGAAAAGRREGAAGRSAADPVGFCFFCFFCFSFFI